MFTERAASEAEPPQSEGDLDLTCLTNCDCAADIMLTAAPPQSRTHAIVIGRHTLEPVLALTRSGCEAVESHSLDAPAGHLDQASLAWIGDLETSADLDTAVHQASSCLCPDGCMVLDATSMDQPTAVITAHSCLAKVGFRLRSVLRNGSHLVLVAARRPQLALAA